MLLLILAALWAALLLPPYLRGRSEHRPADSIGDFRNQLRVLERSGPTSVAPANTLRGPTPPQYMPPVNRRGSLAAEVGAARRYVAARSMSPEAVRRRATRRRRRDVFLSLVAMTGLSGLIGFVPGLSALWYVSLLGGFALTAYTLLLLRMRTVAAEREMKLRFLPPPGHGHGHAAHGRAPAGAGGIEPALVLRRSAN